MNIDSFIESNENEEEKLIYNEYFNDNEQNSIAHKNNAYSLNEEELLTQSTVVSQTNVNLDQLPITLVNTMASFNLDCEIDLRQLVISCRNIEYNPNKLSAATIRFQKPRIAATVFACGKVSLCGNGTINEIKHYAKLVTKLVLRCGHDTARCCQLKVDSLAFSASCGFPIRLENLALDHAKYCNYEPDIYCGLVYRYRTSETFKATILVYVSGRLLITGCKRPSQAYEVYKNIYSVLYQYRG